MRLSLAKQKSSSKNQSRRADPKLVDPADRHVLQILFEIAEAFCRFIPICQPCRIIRHPAGNGLGERLRIIVDDRYIDQHG